MSKRKNNFSGSEIKTLICQCRHYSEELFSKLKTNKANTRKTEVWCHITDCINSRNGGAVTRTVEEIRKKWRDLLSRSKKDMALQNQTGPEGTAQPNISKFSTQILEFYHFDVEGLESESWNDEEGSPAQQCSSSNGDYKSKLLRLDESEDSWNDPTAITLTNHIAESPKSSKRIAMRTSKRNSLSENATTTTSQGNRPPKEGDQKLRTAILAPLQNELLRKKIRKIELEQEKLIAERDKLRVETEVLILKKTKLNLEIEVLKTDYP